MCPFCDPALPAPPSARHWALFSVLVAVAIFWDLGSQEVSNVNEAQRLLPAAEMLEGGDWVVPRIEGAVYIAKPPLIYWLIAGAYALAGDVSAAVGRFPVAVAAALLLAAMPWVARRASRPWAGFWGALALASMYYFRSRAQQAMIDGVLTGAIFGAVVFLREASRASSKRWRLACAISAVFWGAAFLLKGPVIVPFLGAALGAARWVERATWRRLAALGAGCLGGALLIGLPWVASLLARLGWDRVWDCLQDESLTRVYRSTEINSGPVWFYLTHVGAASMPWTLLLPVWFSRRFRAWRFSRGDASFFSYCGAFSVIALVVFSLIRGKETEYLLPIFPFLALCVGLVVEWLTSSVGDCSPKRRLIDSWRWGLLVAMLMGCAAPIAAFTRYGPAFTDTAKGGLALATTVALSVFGFRAAWRRKPGRPTVLAAVSALVAMTAAAHYGIKYRADALDSPAVYAELARRLSREGVRAYRYDLRKSTDVWHLRHVAENLPDQTEEARQVLAQRGPALVVLRRKRLERFERRFSDLLEIREAAIRGPGHKYAAVRVRLREDGRGPQ